MVEMDGRSEWSVGMYEKMAVCRIPAAWEGGGSCVAVAQRRFVGQGDYDFQKTEKSPILAPPKG
ncbi:hypothetical protein DWX10_21285 [Clostridium sp. AF18-27]|nr:hypothetical protein DWX10_21285 [Clostridium sp. AF18-27]